MVILHRFGGLTVRDRRRRDEPSLSQVVLGVAAFLILAAACLYLVAQAGS